MHAVERLRESKLAGDMAVLKSGAAHRCAYELAYSAGGKNFVRTMLRLGADRDRPAWSTIRSARRLADVLADTTLQILAQSGGDISAMLREKGGLINVAASGRSWHGFARQIFSHAVMGPTYR